MHCTSPTESVKVIVVERGSLLSSEVLTPSDRVSQVLAVMQGPGETLGSFADRTALRLARLESAGHNVVEAAIAIGPWPARVARAARDRLGREICDRLSGDARDLVFFADMVPVDARHELLALAGTLGADGATGRTCRVSVRFGALGGGGPSRSGPGVSTGNTRTGFFCAGSAIELASGYSAISSGGHWEALGG